MQQLTNWQQLHIMAARTGAGQWASGPSTYNENNNKKKKKKEEGRRMLGSREQQTMTERNLLPFVDMPLVSCLAQLAHPLSVMDWAVKSIMII